MKMLKKSTLSLALILLMNIVSYSQWTMSNGLEGGELRDIVVIDSLMFTVSPEGYIYSKLETSPWAINYDQGKYNRICKVGDCLIAFDKIGDNHAVRSFDAGVSWEEVPNMDNIDKITILDSILFVSDLYFNMRSLDYGDSFDTIDTPYFPDETMYIFSDGEELYLSLTMFNSVMLYKSNNYGDSWEEINSNGLSSDENCYGLSSLCKINGKMWGIASRFCTGFLHNILFYYDESLNQWVDMKKNLPPNSRISSIFGYNGIPYVAIDNYPVYRFNETDSLWEEFADATHSANSVLVNNNTIYAACDQGLCTIDSLGNWTSHYAGLNNRDVSSINVFDNKIYITANDELFVSDDYAVSFTQIQGIHGFDLFIEDSIWYCPAQNDFNISYDAGNTWQSSINGVQTGMEGSAACFAQNTNNLFLGTVQGIYKTNKNYISWNKLDVSKLNYISNVESIGASVLLEASYIDFELYFSNNNGTTFESLNIGIAPTESIENEFYYFESGLIYYSEDPLLGWNEILFEPGFIIRGFDRNEDVLVATTANWNTSSPLIYLSLDGGDTWESIIDNLSYLEDSDFNYSKVKIYDNLILYDNADYGLWYRDDLLTGTKENSLSQENKLHVTVSPNPFVNSTKISFNLDEKYEVNLQIVNVNGEIVESMSSIENSGKYEFVWDASSFPAGIYFYHIKTEKAQARGKLILAH